MIRRISTVILYVLAVAVLALYLPRGYDLLVMQPVEKTHLFYSAVSERFIFTEKVIGHDAQAAAMAEDHHADVRYKDEDGKYYTRLEFERLLPFIYYRNMELRGYLPLELQGKTFTAAMIREERRVLELPAGAGERPNAEPLWPLIESQPGQAGLVFPEERCRFTASRLEFVNADTVVVDEELTTRYTKALLEAGFVFPARAYYGNFTILKPSEGGVFIVDDTGQVFHLIRVNDAPNVTKTGIDPAVGVRFMRISESKTGALGGLVLGAGNRVYILTSSMDLRPLPVEGYDAGLMDFKIIFDPLHQTAVWSDEATVYAAVMDRNDQLIAAFSHAMSRGVRTWKEILRDILFPFTVELQTTPGAGVDIAFAGQSGLYWVYPLTGLFLASLYLFVRRARKKELPLVKETPFVGGILLLGLYGLLAVLALRQES